MVKKHYTTDVLFNVILSRLKSNSLIPSIIDYSSSCKQPVSIDTDEWDCIYRVEFGGSEGIYLTLYLEGNLDGDTERAKLGTFKTLYESKEAYKAMSDLGVEFVFALSEFVDANPDSFCWTGYSLRSDGEKDRLSMWCGTHQSAMNRIKRYLCVHPERTVSILKNETGDKKTYSYNDMARIENIIQTYEG